MLLPYTVCLFGHRQIENVIEVEAALRAEIEKILAEHEYVEFLIGREGEFDILAASVIKSIMRTRNTGNSSLTLVMPYLRADFEKNQAEYEAYYDSVELCEESAAAHPKAAIQIRNRLMVDPSDLCVFYVTHPSGGAFQTMKYVENTNRKTLNIEVPVQQLEEEEPVSDDEKIGQMQDFLKCFDGDTSNPEEGRE